MMRLLTEYADCPRCGRTVAVYCPRHGDGSVRITYWHKPHRGARWCRAEVSDWHAVLRTPRKDPVMSRKALNPPRGECRQCWRHAYDPEIHRRLAPRQDCPECVAHMGGHPDHMIVR